METTTPQPRPSDSITTYRIQISRNNAITFSSLDAGTDDPWEFLHLSQARAFAKMHLFIEANHRPPSGLPAPLYRIVDSHGKHHTINV